MGPEYFALAAVVAIAGSFAAGFYVRGRIASAEQRLVEEELSDSLEKLKAALAQSERAKEASEVVLGARDIAARVAGGDGLLSDLAGTPAPEAGAPGGEADARAGQGGGGNPGALG